MASNTEFLEKAFVYRNPMNGVFVVVRWCGRYQDAWVLETIDYENISWQEWKQIGWAKKRVNDRTMTWSPYVNKLFRGFTRV
jgi:hypothetical protein